jgi:predicted RNase H-like HicB family nuclease
MRKLHYLVHISREVESDWGASVPDLPGCVAAGKTLDTTLRRIQGAIELHLRGLREDGVAPPRPRRKSIQPSRTPRHIDFYATVEVAA